MSFTNFSPDILSALGAGIASGSALKDISVSVDPAKFAAELNGAKEPVSHASSTSLKAVPKGETAKGDWGQKTQQASREKESDSGRLTSKSLRVVKKETAEFIADAPLDDDGIFAIEDTEAAPIFIPVDFSRVDGSEKTTVIAENEFLSDQSFSGQQEDILLGEEGADIKLTANHNDAPSKQNLSVSSQGNGEKTDLPHAPMQVEIIKEQMQAQPRNTGNAQAELMQDIRVADEALMVQNGASEKSGEKTLMEQSIARLAGGNPDGAKTESSSGQNNQQNAGQNQTSAQGGYASSIAHTQQIAQNSTSVDFKAEVQGGQQIQSLGGASSAGQTQIQKAESLMQTPVTRAPLNPQSTAQVMDQIKVQIKQAMNGDTITVKLRPESLGSVDVRLELNGRQVVAHVMTDRQDTLQMLKEDAHQLAQALKDLGLEASANDMNFNLQGQHQEQNEKFTGYSTHSSAQTVLAEDDRSHLDQEGRYEPLHHGTINVVI